MAARNNLQKTDTDPSAEDNHHSGVSEQIPRRLAVVITNTYTNTNTQLTPLEGVIKDRDELNKTFSSERGFHLKGSVDACEAEIRNAIELAAEDARSNSYECVFIVFSGHGHKKGNQSFILDNVGVQININDFLELVIKQFGRDIPKIILIDACRGERAVKKGQGDNCLIAYATKDGDVAMASKTFGSYWITRVAECLRTVEGSVLDALKQAEEKMRDDPNITIEQQPVIGENSLNDTSLSIYIEHESAKDLERRLGKRKQPEDDSLTTDMPANKKEKDLTYLQDKPTFCQLMNIVGNEIQDEWKDLGLHLGLPKYTLQRIGADHNTVQEKLLAMFIEWERSCHSDHPFIWSTLDNALRSLNCIHLANSINQKINKLKSMYDDLCKTYSKFSSEPKFSDLLQYVGSDFGRQKYKFIGLELGLDVNTIEGISTQPQNDQMLDVFTEWERRDIKDRPFTWKIMLVALHMPQVGLKNAAQKISEKLLNKVEF